MQRLHALTLTVALALALAGCFDPSDRRPGTRLSGEVVAYPADWSFATDQREIAIEVSGFLGLPHSVTIWCTVLDGELYLGAANPDTKRWPAWADADPNVRLKIGGAVYEVQLSPLEDAELESRVRAATIAKYRVPEPKPGEPTPAVRYWSVGPRE